MGRRIATIGIPLLFVVVIFAGCSSAPVATSSTPTIYRSPQFQWQPDQHTHQISVPTTAQNPGPVITLHARHQLGLGVLITATGSEPLQTAVNTSQQVLNDEILHLRQFGWKALFTPTAEGDGIRYLILYSSI